MADEEEKTVQPTYGGLNWLSIQSVNQTQAWYAYTPWLSTSAGKSQYFYYDTGDFYNPTELYVLNYPGYPQNSDGYGSSADTGMTVSAYFSTGPGATQTPLPVYDGSSFGTKYPGKIYFTQGTTRIDATTLTTTNDGNTYNGITQYTDGSIDVWIPNGVTPGNWTLELDDNCGNIIKTAIVVPVPKITQAPGACPGGVITVTGTNLTLGAIINIGSSPWTAMTNVFPPIRTEKNVWELDANFPTSPTRPAGNYLLSPSYTTYEDYTNYFNFTEPANCAGAEATLKINGSAGPAPLDTPTTIDAKYNGTDITSLLTPANYYIKISGKSAFLNSTDYIFETGGVYSIFGNSTTFPQVYDVYFEYEGFQSNIVPVSVESQNPLQSVVLTATTYSPCATVADQLTAIYTNASGSQTNVTDLATYHNAQNAVNGSGVFVESTTGTYNVFATYNPGSGLLTSNTITLTVQNCILPTLTIIPGQTTLLAAQQQQFTSLYNANQTGSQNTDVTSSATWYVNGVLGGNSTVGTITTDGLYVAPGIISTQQTVTVTATYDGISGTSNVNLLVSGSNVAVLTVVSQINIFLGDGRSGYIPVGTQIQAYPGEYIYVQFAETLDANTGLPIASNTDVQVFDTPFTKSALDGDIANQIYNMNQSTQNADGTISTYRTVVIGIIDPSDGRFHSMWDIAEDVGTTILQHSIMKDLLSKDLPKASLVSGNKLFLQGELNNVEIAASKSKEVTVVLPNTFHDIPQVTLNIDNKKVAYSIVEVTKNMFKVQLTNQARKKTSLKIVWYYAEV